MFHSDGDNRADRQAVRQTTVRPTGVERTFDSDDIIVSKTDPKGIITYANDVFLRVSGYAEEEVLGQPHNIIRHPDMPRCVFKLLWDTIAGGEEIFAYVLNLAADGAHYWVVAHVTPTFGRRDEIIGYHSNRRLPHRGDVAEIAPIYQALLVEERRHTQTPAAIAAGTAKLQHLLAERGQDYDEFVWSIGHAPTSVGSAR
jgi:PAS domain S-box-containing protein